MVSPSARVVRLLALMAAVPTVALGGLAMLSQDSKHVLAHGPLISGHAEVACDACHVESTGSIRQQIQAQLHYAFGSRATAVDFGYQEVTSKACLACHARPNERHPIYRFQEPRFAQAVQMVDARSCLGCHSEHREQVVHSAVGVCQACHEGIKVKNDPIDIKHEILIDQNEWESCLGCHDFHGNHAIKAPLHIAEAIPAEVIRQYFLGGPDPYGEEKLYEARTE
ncbi:cytochrome c3 family protein [Shimia sp. R9_1]|uniref:cytochrome c3 family protein n=1 Tax=Shimia sp. R9_1 TaxID=2821111 RepID=UPI001ADB72EA|nr:cytochrome c3 family protein [Shimia sp. R9_1]MBO9408795.1 cytochrome c3 family protein [Shimia sp. R9_1]